MFDNTKRPPEVCVGCGDFADRWRDGWRCADCFRELTTGKIPPATRITDSKCGTVRATDRNEWHENAVRILEDSRDD